MPTSQMFEVASMPTTRLPRLPAADFSKIKRVVSNWIDANLDHRMILNKDDPMLPLFKQQGEPFFLLDVNPTAENIAREIFRVTQDKGLPVTRVTLWETEKSFATYRP